MSLLSYNQLIRLIETNVINADRENVNSSSIDITLDDIIMVEAKGGSKFTTSYGNKIVMLSEKENINMTKCDLNIDCFNRSYSISPGKFILASSREVFNLPDNISAEYKLKSSMARNGLEHLNAGWCDAGWNNSKLTLELKNMTQYHDLVITAGMKIGQVVFFEHEEVPGSVSYRNRGRYNGQTEATSSKGIE